MANKKTIIGTSGDDIETNALIGDDQSNTLRGLAGDDELDGGGGRDRLYGDAGNDLLIYDSQDSEIRGGSGFDTLRFLTDGQLCDLGKKRIIDGIEAIDFVSNHNELVLTAKSLERISDTDSLVVTGGHDNRVHPGTGWQFDGFSDDGRFYEFSQGRVMLQTETSVQVVGFNESTPVMQEAGNDYWDDDLYPDNDSGITNNVHGGEGDDTFFSTGEMAQLFGDGGNDYLNSLGMASVLHGGDGIDILVAADSAVMYGDAGDDFLFFDGGGVRIGYGGEGADSFSINYVPNVGQDFRIRDFSAAEGDRINLQLPSTGSTERPQIYLAPLNANDSLYELGYRDSSSNPHPLVQLVGSHLQLTEPFYTIGIHWV